MWAQSLGGAIHVVNDCGHAESDIVPEITTFRPELEHYLRRTHKEANHGEAVERPTTTTTTTSRPETTTTEDQISLLQSLLKTRRDRVQTSPSQKEAPQTRSKSSKKPKCVTRRMGTVKGPDGMPIFEHFPMKEKAEIAGGKPASAEAPKRQVDDGEYQEDWAGEERDYIQDEDCVEEEEDDSEDVVSVEEQDISKVHVPVTKRPAARRTRTTTPTTTTRATSVDSRRSETTESEANFYNMAPFEDVPSTESPPAWVKYWKEEEVRREEADIATEKPRIQSLNERGAVRNEHW